MEYGKKDDGLMFLPGAQVRLVRMELLGIERVKKGLEQVSRTSSGV